MTVFHCVIGAGYARPYSRTVPAALRRCASPFILLSREGEQVNPEALDEAVATLEGNPAAMAALGGLGDGLVGDAHGLFHLFTRHLVLPAMLVRREACHRALLPMPVGLPDQWRSLAGLARLGPIALACAPLCRPMAPWQRLGRLEEIEDLDDFLADQQSFAALASRLETGPSMDHWRQALDQQRAAGLVLAAEACRAAGTLALAEDMLARAKVWAPATLPPQDNEDHCRMALDLVARLAPQLGEQIRQVMIEDSLAALVPAMGVPMRLAPSGEMAAHPPNSSTVLVFDRAATAQERRRRTGGVWAGFQFALEDLTW
ncbi:MAG: hypothetical protein H7Y60_13560 [Rhodospirillaceae bacterium]|nr:hypothetical protein [Rhodospirillales bacterium]